MDYRLGLKGKFISLLIDGAKHGDKNFSLFFASNAEKLDFIDSLNLESRRRLTITQHIGPIIRKLSI
jgi:hypothetical protein